MSIKKHESFCLFDTSPHLRPRKEGKSESRKSFVSCYYDCIYWGVDGFASISGADTSVSTTPGLGTSGKHGAKGKIGSLAGTRPFELVDYQASL